MKRNINETCNLFITYGFELVTRGFELVPRGFERNS